MAAMTTTCPACHTRFRVTSEQMDAHGGDVRCGRCAKVFNAHAYLEHELEELQHEGQARLPFEEPGGRAVVPEEDVFLSPGSLPEERPHLNPLPQEGEEANVEDTSPDLRDDVSLCGFHVKQQPVAVEEFPVEEPETSSFEGAPVEEYLVQPLQAVDELLPEFPVEVESSIPEWGEEGSSEAPEAAEFPLPEPVVSAPAEAVTAEPDTLAPQFVPEPVPEWPVAPDTFAQIADEPKKRHFFWLWLIGALLLLASLSVQGLYFFRSDLAARHPEFKPLLQQLCGVLQCGIHLPADPDLLGIDTSNLEADPQQANLVMLNAILRNRAKLAQEYPQLELTLTDTQDRMMARRIFTPGEYAKGADLKRGMAPNEEVTVKLNLDLGDLKAAGYRVFLFYPQ